MAPGAGRPVAEPFDRRKAFLGGAALMLAGCAGSVFGRDPQPEPAARAYPGPYLLRIAIFEQRQLDLPFHSGLLIHAPEGRILYDPAGWWRHDQCRRSADVFHPMTDRTEADYLARGSFVSRPGFWRLHLFEARVGAEVASLAHARALARAPQPALGCAYAVADLLSGLPGFEDIRPRIVTAEFLDALIARPGLSYTVRVLA